MKKEESTEKRCFLERNRASSEWIVALAAFSALESEIDLCIIGMSKTPEAGEELLSCLRENTLVKLKILHAMGFLSDSANKNLLSLKVVRNLFAGDMDVESFEDPRICDAMNELRISNRALLSGRSSDTSGYHDDPTGIGPKNSSYPGDVFVEACGAYRHVFQKNRTSRAGRAQQGNIPRQLIEQII